MKKFLVIFQFEHGTCKLWSQDQIQRVMTSYRATYIARGVYMVLTPDTSEEMLAKILKAGELNKKDFVGIYPVEIGWVSSGGSQRGSAQPEWPPENEISMDDCL